MFKRQIIPWIFILLLSISLVLVNRSAMATAPQISSTPAIGSFYAELNEVMPKPGEGDPAWVELYIGQVMQTIYLPVVQKIATGSDQQQP